MEIVNLLEFSDRTQLRQWLELNHCIEKQCWVLCSRSKPVPKGVMPYVDVVEEALCFGWIDSTFKRIAEGRGAQRLSPRRKNSLWTELNLQRYAMLEKQGLMTDAGRSALPHPPKHP